MTSDVRAGVRLASARLRTRSIAVSAGLGAALVLTSAIIERHFGSAGAVDRALESTFNVVVPLLSFVVVGTVVGRRRLEEATWSVARYGGDRRWVALGLVAGAVGASAVIAALAATLTAVAAHAAPEPPLVRDAFTSAWVGALSGGAYAAWFCFGATFGKRGGARWIALFADAALAGSSGVAAALFPRAHAENLLGGQAPAHLGQGSSALALVVTALVLSGLAAARSGP